MRRSFDEKREQLQLQAVQVQEGDEDNEDDEDDEDDDEDDEDNEDDFESLAAPVAATSAFKKAKGEVKLRASGQKWKKKFVLIVRPPASLGMPRWFLRFHVPS